MDVSKCDVREFEKDLFPWVSCRCELNLCSMLGQNVRWSRSRNLLQGARWPCELVFSLLASQKCDLGEVEKTMLRGVCLAGKPIFSLLGGTKCDLEEVEKTMIQGVKGSRKSFSAFWPTQNATWMMCVYVAPLKCVYIYIYTLFNGATVPTNSFSAFCPAEGRIRLHKARRLI